MALTATITITTIANQLVGVPFSVNGTYTLSEATWTDVLVYQDGNGAQIPISSAPVQLGTTSWTFTNPGLTAGPHTVSIKDPLTGTTVTSNTFTVGVGPSIAVTQPTSPVAGVAFQFRGVLTGYTTAPSLTYILDGSQPQQLSGVSPIGWNTQLTVASSGTHTIFVTDGTVNSPTLTFSVAPASSNHVITPTSPGSVAAGSVFTFAGSLGGYTAVPSLTYSLNGGGQVTMSGVTLTGWSMSITAPTNAGSSSLTVSDGTVSSSVTFTVTAAAKVVTPNTPSGVVAGTSFTFTGSLQNYTTIPSLTYTLSGGVATALTGVSVTGWAMTITVPTAGTFTITVNDTTNGVSGVTSSFVVTTPVQGATRSFATNPGQDGSFWVTPFATTASWITSGALVTALRNGSNSSPTGYLHAALNGQNPIPFYTGQPTDPMWTVTDGTLTITVPLPAGAVDEGNGGADNAIGGADLAHPYRIWSINVTSMNTSTNTINGDLMQVDDGSGLYFCDQVTGQLGFNNSGGLITDYDLTQANANPSYVVPHMLAYDLDPSQVNLTLAWPLNDADPGQAGGPLSQGLTIGIPASTARLSGMTRGQAFLFDQMQHFGGMMYNLSGNGCWSLNVGSPTSPANNALIQDISNNMSWVTQFLCILNPNSGVTGGQFSLATSKGQAAGGVPAFPSPPPLDLSPTGGANISPSTFAAWYSNNSNHVAPTGTYNGLTVGYNVTPTNTTGTVTKTITPVTPTNVVAGTAFTFTGALSGYSSPPTLTYSLNGGSSVALSGVTLTGWSASITIQNAAASDTLTVTDAADSISVTTAAFAVTTGTVTPPPTPVTWNPAAVGGPITLSNSNYTATSGGSTSPGTSDNGVLATAAISTTTVVMWEVTVVAATQNYAVGVADGTFALTNPSGAGSDTHAIGAYISTGAGSQPAQTVYYNNNQLTAGNGVSETAGDIATLAVNGLNFYFSTPAMRTTSGVLWNNSTTANPITNIGGFSFSGISSPYYPLFNDNEGGGIATLNDGTRAFSAFGASFVSANPSVKTLSGQVTAGSSKSITPQTPAGVVVNTPFTFSGSLSGYSTAPSLTYAVNGGAATTLAGVTATGWNATITLSSVATDTITVTDGTVTGSTAAFQVSGTSGGGNRVPAPLSGTVTPGSWVSGRINVAAMPNGFMAYAYLLPAQYNTSLVYPLLFYGHENDEGMSNGVYPNDPLGLVNQTVINGTFNTVAFRTNFPAIVVVPLCDQTIDGSGSNGNSNFGGYNDTANSGGNEQGINALNQFFVSNFAVDSTRRYTTGDSLGAIGSLAWLVDNNQQNGVLKLWTAAVCYSDQLYRPAVNGGNNTNYFGPMTTVPLMAASTPNDNNQASYDQPAWQFYTGNSNYPSPAAYASGGMAAIRAGTSQFYYIFTTSDVPWDTYRQLNADGGQGTAIYTWLFSQVYGSTSSTVSITGVTISGSSATAGAAVGTAIGSLTATASGGTLTGVAFSISSQSSSGAFKLSGATLQIANGSLGAGSYTVNISVSASNATNSPQTYPLSITVTSGTSTGAFRVSGGQILNPNGAAFKALGINCGPQDMGNVQNNALRLFPGLNFIRFATYYTAPSNYVSQYPAFANWATANKIVIEFEDHAYPSPPAYTGSQLNAESSWYQGLAHQFLGNPYIWFGGINEPGDSGTYSAQGVAISAQYQATYNAIRGQGNNNPLMLNYYGGGNPGSVGAGFGLTSSTFAGMHNIVWDLHFYGWPFASNNNQTFINNYLAGSVSGGYGIAAAQTIQSADGIVPVIVGEFGNSASGGSVDFNGAQVVQAVLTNGHGYAAWTWGSASTEADNLVLPSQNLTNYGALVAAAIARG